MKKFTIPLLVLILTISIAGCEGTTTYDSEVDLSTSTSIPECTPSEALPTKYDSQEASSQQEKMLTVAVAEEYPPFEYYENGELIGFDIDLINHIADRLGYKIEFSQMQFDTFLMAVNAGKVDCAISGIIATPERENVVNFTSPYITIKIDSDGTETETYAIAINPNDNELLSEINQIIREAQNDGTIQNLIKKYNIQNADSIDNKKEPESNGSETENVDPDMPYFLQRLGTVKHEDGTYSFKGIITKINPLGSVYITTSNGKQFSTGNADLIYNLRTTTFWNERKGAYVVLYNEILEGYQPGMMEFFYDKDGNYLGFTY